MGRRGKGRRKGTHLEADDVGAVVEHLLEDQLLAVVPVEGPGRGVAVHLARRVLVAQDVVAQERERLLGPLVGLRQDVGLDGEPRALGRRRRDRARVAQVGDEGGRAVLLDEGPQRLGERVALDAERVEEVEGAELGRERRQVVVEEEEVAKAGEEAELGGEGRQLVARRVEEGQVLELADGRRELGEGVVRDVEGRQERVPEQGARQVLEVHAAHVDRRPRVLALLLVVADGAVEPRGGEPGARRVLGQGRAGRRRARAALLEARVLAVQAVEGAGLCACCTAAAARAAGRGAARAVRVGDRDGVGALASGGEVGGAGVVVGRVGGAARLGKRELLGPMGREGPAAVDGVGRMGRACAGAGPAAEVVLGRALGLVRRVAAAELGRRAAAVAGMRLLVVRVGRERVAVVRLLLVRRGPVRVGGRGGRARVRERVLRVVLRACKRSRERVRVGVIGER